MWVKRYFIFQFIENIENKLDFNNEYELNNNIEISTKKRAKNKINLNKDDKNKYKLSSINWFQNEDNSCAYDSIITIYILSLKKFIDIKIVNYFLIIIENL